MCQCAGWGDDRVGRGHQPGSELVQDAQCQLLSIGQMEAQIWTSRWERGSASTQRTRPVREAKGASLKKQLGKGGR